MEVIECRSCSRADECYLGKSYVNLEALFAGCGANPPPEIFPPIHLLEDHLTREIRT